MDTRKSEDLAAELLARITALPVIDTHEHTATEAEFLAGSYDFADLMSYVGLDLGLAGLPAEPWGGAQWAPRIGGSVAEKWERIAPFWPHVRTGVYARAYRRMLRRFFGVDDLDGETVHEVSGRITDYQQPGVYDRFLHREYGIRAMLHAQGAGPSPEPQHFAPVYCFDGLAGATSAASATAALGQELPGSFADFRDLVDEYLQRAPGNGIVGLKIGGTARCRPIEFADHPPAAVEESYRFLREEADGNWLDVPTASALKPFQDAAHWAVFEAAGQLGLPVQVHSGLEFMQPWDGRPSALIPSLIRFPETKFAVFHGSYPHMAELTGLAKSFPNVYLDLAWFHLLSEHQARAWLAEWLDVLPHNKLFAFGGDVFLFFGACAHLELARENVAAVLAGRVAAGLCDLDEAEHTARLLFHDNPWQTFRMDNWRGREA